MHSRINPTVVLLSLVALATTARSGWPAEFEITADSFTIDKQVNLSSAAYFQGQASAPGNPAAATQLTSPGGLYFDGTYYKVWNSQTSAWVQVATGTLSPGAGSWTETAPGADVHLSNASDNAVIQSTLTVQGGAFSVGGSTLVVTGGNVGIGTVSPAAALHVVGISSFTASITVNGVQYAYVPSGMVSFFDLAVCPSGWTEFTQARGRYPLGLPGGGTLAGTDGTALSNLEDRPTGAHTHPINDPGHTHSVPYSYGAAGPYYLTQGYSTPMGANQTETSVSVAYTGITVLAPAGSVAGTNAPYVQLLACVKE